MYISILVAPTAEEEEREKLAKEVSKDWSAGIYLGVFHFEFDFPVLYNATIILNHCGCSGWQFSKVA